MGLSPHQKLTSAIHQLAYESSANSPDEYIRIGKTNCLRTLNHFINDVVELYEGENLRPPRPEEWKAILNEHEERGFPGFIGTIDGMHWEWKDFPKGW